MFNLVYVKYILLAFSVILSLIFIVALLKYLKCNCVVDDTRITWGLISLGVVLVIQWLVYAAVSDIINSLISY